METLINHLNATFSKTDNIITYGELYLCILAPAAVLIGIGLLIKRDRSAKA
jgi:hypothetical protein